MARPLRIEFPGAVYHIFQRGLERKNIFTTDRDRNKFIRYLAIAARRHNCLIFAYCLMSNHFHLIVNTLRANLSKFMHCLNTSYVTYFNTRLKRVGPLYQGRYGSILVQQGEYLQHLSRYIHMNPVRAKIVKDPIDYQYSSYKYFSTIANAPDWLATNQILREFSSNYKEAKRFYQDYVINHPQDSGEYLKSNTRHGIVLGSEKYFEHIKKEYLEGMMDAEIPLLNQLKNKINPRHILNIIDSEITDKKLNQKIKIYFLRELTDNTLKEVGDMLGGLNYKSVSKIYMKSKELISSNDPISNLVDNIENKIMANVET